MLKKAVDPQLEAKQLEWAKKKWVWVPDEKAGCLAAHIVKEDGNNVTVKMSNGEERVMDKNDIDQMNPPKFDKCEDMATLTALNESSVLHNLTDRYQSNLIYTYSGLFLVVINPWRRLPLYTDEMVVMYKGKKRKDMPPHVFAVCDEAYRDMLENKENQSLLITGESGAGKTENTKKVIQYLASVAGASSSSGMQAGQLEKQIVKTNPLLESFGNAKTVRNNNSSRFGKFIRIEFGSDGKIVGCLIDNYLLEKSRVVRHAQNERGFHIFYQLMDGASAEMKKDLLLGSLRDYKYLLGTTNVDGVDNAKDFQETIEAMDIIGFTEEEKTHVWSVVSACAQFGNLNFTSGRRDDTAQMPDSQAAEKCAHLLGLNADEFAKCLLKPRVKAGKEFVTAMVTSENAFHSCDALAKTTYERLFKWIVRRINAALEVTSSAASFIGCLDIAGFEIFETNSFEQICINLTNEKLQQFFNHHMFTLEQEEYMREGIDWTFVDFGLDLQPTIDLIEKPLGIMSILDEECVFPKATDKSFITKLHQTHDKKSPKYSAVRMHPSMFQLVHYAGVVGYETENWLEKNKDPINDNVAVLLSRSRIGLICTLFEDIVPPEDESKRRKGAAFITVSQRHRQQLNALMTTLMNTSPHFVRCIIPNEQKKAGVIDPPLVLDQLRCNGVLEGIRIVRMGFPNRVPFAEFKQRYEILAVGAIPKGFIGGREACLKLVEALKVKQADFRTGVSKIFFKAGIIAEIEEARDAKLGALITGFQAVARGYLARAAFRRQHGKDDAIKLIQKNARVFIHLYNWPWWKLYRSVKPLLSIHRQEQEERALLNKIKDLEERVAEELKKREALDKEKVALTKEAELLEDELQAEKETLEETVASLKRTEEKREEFEALVKDLEEQLDDADLMSSEMEKSKRKLLEQVKDAEAQLDDESETLAAIETAKKQKDAEFEEMDRQAKADRDRLEGELEADKDRLEGTIANLKTDLTAAKSQLDRQRKQAKQLQTDKDDLVSAVEQSEAGKAKAEKAAKKIQIELDASREAHADLSSKTASLTESKRNNEAELAKLRAKMATLDASKTAQETKAKNLEEDFEEMTKKANEAQGASAAADRINKALELEIDEFADKLSEATDQSKEFELKAKALQKEADEKSEALKKAKEEADAKLLAALKAEREKTQALEEALMKANVRRSVAEESYGAENIKIKDSEAKLRELREMLRH